MGDLRFTFKIEPDGAQFDRVLRLRFGKILDFKPVFEKVAKLIYQDIKQNFTSGGSVAGGWTPLSRRYAEQKAKDFRAGLIKFNKIMYRTGRLADSLISPKGKDAVFEVTDTSLEIGTRVPYALAHQTGTKRLPQRRLVALSDGTRREIVRVFQKEALKQGEFNGDDSDLPF